MAVCKACEKEYHYCTTCDPELCCDNGFCSDRCMENSKEFLDAKEITKVFYKSLRPIQREMFDKVMEYEYDFGYHFEDWIKELKEEETEDGRN